MTVRIWLAAAAEIDLTPARGSFSAEELDRAGRIGSAPLRQRFLARRWMARSLLAAATGEEPGALVLEERCERCGDLHPASPLGAGGPPVWWSASDSAGLAAVAIGPNRLGLDLERNQARPRWERIAARYFSPAEQRVVAGSPAGFLETWTLKEAYLKAIGMGLPGGLDALDCSRLGEGEGGWRLSPAHPGWRFRNVALAPGFVAALAVEGTPDSIEVSHWDGASGGAG